MNKRMNDEGGFTLIELLVTIAILAVLFGIVTLTLGGLSTSATANSCAAELAVVQSAVDIHMAATLSSAVPTVSPAEQIDGGEGAWTVYLRSLPTLGDYAVAADGAVTPGACP